MMTWKWVWGRQREGGVEREEKQKRCESEGGRTDVWMSGERRQDCKQTEGRKEGEKTGEVDTQWGGGEREAVALCLSVFRMYCTVDLSVNVISCAWVTIEPVPTPAHCEKQGNGATLLFLSLTVRKCHSAVGCSCAEKEDGTGELFPERGFVSLFRSGFLSGRAEWVPASVREWPVKRGEILFVNHPAAVRGLCLLCFTTAVLSCWQGRAVVCIADVTTHAPKTHIKPSATDPGVTQEGNRGDALHLPCMTPHTPTHLHLHLHLLITCDSFYISGTGGSKRSWWHETSLGMTPVHTI